MTLFDPNAYTSPGAKPREARTPKLKDPPPPTVEVVMDERWRWVHRSQPGVRHVGAKVDNKRGGVTITYCGLVGTPLTFEPGERSHGCGICAAAIGMKAAS